MPLHGRQDKKEPRRSLPRLLGSPCILQGRADGMYRKALRCPRCLSPWLGARRRLGRTWACGSCGCPCRCDTSPLCLPAAQRHGVSHGTLPLPARRAQPPPAPQRRSTPHGWTDGWTAGTAPGVPPARPGALSRCQEFGTVTCNQSAAPATFLHFNSKAGIWANSPSSKNLRSSKNLNSSCLWCCGEGMYTMKTIRSTSLPFFH